ncbi:hypothetical protein [Telmatospirillum sp.]|uniref:hypothetical protein n=1 Tax=Telmatospirillum sp. TaxID=2079197 RepID=UPI002842F13D|nr:hypothetical protein [Telmatospirillum sp.]MDR3439247.1 hypothetical protein [Telmatospirillum sp.]
MSANGRAALRQMVESLLFKYLRQVEDQSRGGPLDSRQLHQSAQAFLASPQLGRILADAHRDLLDAAEKELVRQKRGDPFYRLLTHPLTEPLNDGRLSRDMLVNYFSFLHLVLGDARDVLARRCAELLAEHRDPDPLAFSWDSFYNDPDAKLVLWAVLIRIAESFRRFDARREWFIGLMQNRPQAVSIASNAFLPRHSGTAVDDPSSFGVTEFNVMFSCLFGGLRRLSPTDLAAFEKDFGTTPERAFAHLFTALDEPAP